MTEDITCYWTTDCATDWVKYKTLTGKITILAGNDRGSTSISSDDILSYQEASDLKCRNVSHRRSRFEIDEIDQIVLKLDSIDGEGAFIKHDEKRCFISILGGVAKKNNAIPG